MPTLRDEGLLVAIAAGVVIGIVGVIVFFALGLG